MNYTGMIGQTCRCGHPGWTHYARFGPQECLMPGCECDAFLVEKRGRGPRLLVEPRVEEEDDEPPGPRRRS
jgi:hypothetical protein